MVESLRQASKVLENSDHIISYGDIAFHPEIVRIVLNSHQDIAITSDIDCFTMGRPGLLIPCPTLRFLNNAIIFFLQLEIQQKIYLRFKVSLWDSLKAQCPDGEQFYTISVH